MAGQRAAGRNRCNPIHMGTPVSPPSSVQIVSLARLMKSPVIDEMTPRVLLWLWQTESGAGLGELGGLGEPGDVVEANATTQTPTSASIAYGEARTMG